MVVRMSQSDAATSVPLRYLEALERRAPVGELEAMLDEGARIEVLPNRLDPAGSIRSRAEALADVERGRALLSGEEYGVVSTCSQDAHVAIEVAWSGVLAVPLGTLPAGTVLRARCSMHFEVRDERIVAQRNYDCFAPP
jgi:hypothetical protein